jgi:membrane protease subunit HflC
MQQRFAPVALLVLLVVMIAGGALYQVDETEQVIITQFGKPVRGPITTPGLHVKLPFAQTVWRFDKRVLEWDGSPDQMPTLDKRFILVDTTARWRIVDPLLFLQAVGDEHAAQSRLDDLINSAVRDIASGHQLLQAVRSFARELPLQDREEGTTAEPVKPEAAGATPAPAAAPPPPTERLGREILSALMVKRAQQRLADLGIELIDVQLQRINYVREVEQRVFERMISERRSMAARFRSEGEGASANIRGEKERELDRIRSEAYRQAQGIMGKADAEAAGIYATAYAQEPEFYSFLQTLKTYPQTLHKNSSLVLTTDSDLYRYLKYAIDDGGKPTSETSSSREVRIQRRTGDQGEHEEAGDDRRPPEE